MLSYIILFGFILMQSINIKKKYLIFMSFLICFVYFFELTKTLRIDKNQLYNLNFSSFINSDPLFLGLDPLIKNNKEILNKKK